MASESSEKDQANDDDVLIEQLFEKLVAQQGVGEVAMAKQAIQLLLASGLRELFKERQSQSQAQSQPASPDPAAAAAPSVQSPTALVTSPPPLYSEMSSNIDNSSAASSSASSYGMPNHFRQREASIASTASNSTSTSTSTSTGHNSSSYYSPATSHARSFSTSSSSMTSLTSSPSLSSTPSLRRSTTKKRKALKIIDIGTGEKGTISTILTLLAEEGLIHPKEELDITASENEKSSLVKLKEKFKGWKHVSLRTFTPEVSGTKSITKGEGHGKQ